MPEPDPFTPGATPFQGIPQRVLPEDCMEYILLAISPVLSKPALVQQRLREVQAAAESLLHEHASEYIWQREGFQLSLSPVSGVKGVEWSLKGKTEYGDAVDDEWFIVWLLRELSRRFHDVWIRVHDTDGEFLLIEAANVLPRWLNPEIAAHRVWINAGKLYVIPLSAAASSSTESKTGGRPPSRELSFADALATISACNPASLQRIRLVEEEAFFRTASYPTAAIAHLHYALTTVPRRIAALLHARPESVAPATEAFYLRDPIALKAARALKWDDLVTISVKYTKVLYAQLHGQQWDPPRQCAPTIQKGGSAADVGAKLTAGFEMLFKDAVAEAQRELVQDVRTLATSDALLPADEEIAQWGTRQDSDDWLDIDFTQFEADLAGKVKGGAGTANDAGKTANVTAWGDKQAEENMKKMVERFESFLNDDAAGPDGAEFGDEMDEDDEDDDDDDGEDSDSDEDEDKAVSFDEAEFSRMMREMMGLPAENTNNTTATTTNTAAATTTAATTAGDDGAELHEITNIQNQIEAELKAAGAFKRGEKPRTEAKDSAMTTAAVGDPGSDSEEKEEDDDDGEVNVDYTLAKNLLESFKGQGGLAGPGGNLLARMGIMLPRDEGELGDENDDAGRKGAAA